MRCGVGAGAASAVSSAATVCCCCWLLLLLLLLLLPLPLPLPLLLPYPCCCRRCCCGGGGGEGGLEVAECVATSIVRSFREAETSRFGRKCLACNGSAPGAHASHSSGFSSEEGSPSMQRFDQIFRFANICGQVFLHYGTFTRTFLSMFEILFANWSPPCRVLVENVSEWFSVFFLLYRCVLGFAVSLASHGGVKTIDIHVFLTFREELKRSGLAR